MNILDEIIQFKFKEVAERKALFPVKVLEQSKQFHSPRVSLKESILHPEKTGIIAEIKRKSPSKGVINANVLVEQISVGYVQAGVSALSVLTDSNFFGGNNEDLIIARKFNACPILRKDFVVDEYQLIEAKSIGADAILLIAAALEPARLRALAKTARSLQLEILMEVHDEKELLDNLTADVDLIGVNNRDLKTFKMDIDISRRLSDKIPTGFAKVSESGIENPETIMDLKKYGYKGFLMGQNFMQHTRPEIACLEFVTELKRLEKGIVE